MATVQMNFGNRGVTPEAMWDLARLWACRLLVDGRVHRALKKHGRFIDEDMCLFVGLDSQRMGNENGYARQRLRTVRQRCERHTVGWPSPVGDRLGELGRHLSLDEREREILGFLAIAGAAEPLRDAAKLTANYCGLDHIGLMAWALQRDPGEIEARLAPGGRLARSGLLRIDGERGARQFRLCDDVAITGFELLSGLATMLTSRTGSVERFLSTYFQRVATDEEQPLDFTHCAEEQARIGALLEQALEHHEAGVNILIHGEPGVGKTELVRHLSATHGWDLYAVTSEDTEAESLTGRRRFRAYQLCQFLLAERERAVLMFDEIEDVFDPRFVGLPDRTGPLGERGSAGKAWTNRLLETNPRPVIWISNDTDALDPAYLRRFDYILRLDTPPRAVRQRMLARALDGVSIPQAWIETHARDSDMTPARSAQIGRLAHRLESALGDTELPAVLDHQLEQQRSVNRNAPKPGARRENPLDVYALDYLNTRPGPDALLRGLQRRGSGSVLMHGPPGTGKTAFAEHVAEQLGRELISRSASGLLDKFIGETEKAIAGMFAEARSEGAVLLLDEADNFLRSREGANHRWEVTQTNELLVQMERFDGVFLCATNLLDAFDPAALRRFDVKLGFGYLGPEQRWRLFDRLLEARGLALPDGEAQRTLRRRIGALECLTPGDFAAIARGTDLLDPGAEDASSLVERLEQDHWIKPDADGMRVGFV
jgi:SpoVK/Ycf46/Vps4 family AAA+-type ATPase